MRLILQPVAVLAVAVMALSPAAAEDSLFAPAPPDYDEEEEKHSDFWEWTLEPDRDLYDNRVARARRLMERRSHPTAEKEAAGLLREAIELDAERPTAYWYLSELREGQEQWQECTRLRRRIAAIDPAWDPPNSKRPGWALDFGLAFCASRAGDHERALGHYKRVLGRGVQRNIWELRWRMGESYMALGRLDEALVALGEAAKLYSGSPSIHFALAVAYDRDEQPARAREHLLQAVNRDPGLNKLTSSYVTYAPAEDRHYYEALGYRAKGEPEQALVRFRHYLHLTGEGPWTPRVRHHLETLSSESLTSERVQVSGGQGADTEAIGRAVVAAADDLDECVGATTGLLLRAQITTVAKNRGEDRTGNAPEAGFKATVLYSFGAEAEEVYAAIECVEKVAAGIRVPMPQQGYLQVAFPVVAR